MSLTAFAAAAAMVAFAAAPPAAPKLTLLFTGDNWGELAPCG